MLGFAQEYLPLFGRRSIPSGGVARPFHTRSMRSPRALPDRRLSTQTGEGILARTLIVKLGGAHRGRGVDRKDGRWAHLGV